MTKLRECPFCGSMMDSFAGMVPEAFAKGSDGTFSVNCDCGAMGPSAPSIEEAVDAWNARSPDPRLAMAREEMEKIAKDRADWLLDAVACATQDRRFLRGEPEYDEVAGEAILLNAEKAIRVAFDRATLTALEEGK